jgi:competence protein ComEA
MVWLYRLQQRLSITRQEGLAILTLAVLFLLGLAVRHLQQQQIPPVAADSLVAPFPTDSIPRRWRLRGHGPPPRSSPSM